MRKVYKDFNDIPAGLLKQRCIDLIGTALIEKGEHSFDKYYYAHETVKTKLKAVYLNKCAFCEANPTATNPLQVEHFRPKAKVTEDEMHPGYYWLGYEWSNLLWACGSCNSHKGNHFPVFGIRVITHPENAGIFNPTRSKIDSLELRNERAQLVNPEIDPHPMRHFRFQADGTIEHRTADGELSINFYQLKRDPLVLQRKEIVYDWVLNLLMRDLEKFNDGEIGKSELMYSLKNAIIDLGYYMVNPQKQYTEFAKTCWRKFDSFFTAIFRPNERQYVHQAYEEVKAELGLD